MVLAHIVVLWRDRWPGGLEVCVLGPEGCPRGADRDQSSAHRAPQALNASTDERDGGGWESELNLFPSEMTEEKTTCLA